jgi:hypothetical protein
LQWPLLLRRCRDRMPRNFKKLDLIYYKWIVYGIFKGCYVFFLGLNGIEWDYVILVNSKDPGIHPKKEAFNISGWWIVKNPKRPGGLGFCRPKSREDCEQNHVPSGNLTQLWKITMFHGKIHYFYGDFP